MCERKKESLVTTMHASSHFNVKTDDLTSFLFTFFLLAL